MNYSDFEKIEQDKWSLTRPTFPTPKGGTLTVVGWSGRDGKYNKHYVAECSLCKKDKELNGDGVYRSVKSNLGNGSFPCGCSKNPRFTEDQWEVRIRRVAQESGIEFLSFVDGFKGSETKLRLQCLKHGPWESTSISRLVNQGSGCPSCGASKVASASIKGDDYHIAEFMATGRFHKDTKFWRSERENSSGAREYWFYRCPVCSHDDYVKMGLCSGVFENPSGKMKKGQLACRCSKSPKYTEDQWVYRMEKKTKENGHTFVKWVGKPGKGGKFQYLCAAHGVQEVIANNYLRGNGCPSCAGHTQRQCYINQIFDEDLVVALKFGIAKESGRRIKEQNSKNLFKMEQIGIWEFPSVKSCKAAEKQCKKELECGILTERELKDGWTETTHIKNLDRVIEIYDNHGGKRINTNEER